MHGFWHDYWDVHRFEHQSTKIRDFQSVNDFAFVNLCNKISRIHVKQSNYDEGWLDI
jgi:hypothetical protein